MAPWPTSSVPPPRLSALPVPTAEELAALAGRHLPDSGQWEWRRTAPMGPRPKPSCCGVRRAGWKSAWPTACCADGDAAAIAWPELGLVELGNWGESVRQVADGWLPWLPHRNNDELARRFHVVRSDAGRVRLIPAGLPATANTWLEAEFAGANGLPRLWQSQLDGTLSGRLRLATSKGQPIVAMEDGTGRSCCVGS